MKTRTKEEKRGKRGRTLKARSLEEKMGLEKLPTSDPQPFKRSI
jgi:hypothetical protein